MIPRTVSRLGGPRFTTTTTSNSLLRNLINNFSSTASALNEDESESSKFARPATVTWSERLNNSVSLIGTVEYLPKQYDSKDGQVGCYTLLNVKPSSKSNENVRVVLSMWNSVAERALAHLKPNDCVYVSGQLGSYSKSMEGAERLYYKVAVKELNYVEVPDETYQVVAKSESESESESESKADVSVADKIRNRFRLWDSLLANPDDWYDNRKTKKNPRQPDFKHKTTGEAIWRSKDDLPEQLELLDSRLTGGKPSDDVTDKALNYVEVLDETYQVVAKPKSEAGVFGEDKVKNRQRLFELLIANPGDWYDNRKTKKNPRQPDFKHKTTGEAVWLSKDDSPEQLELLDSKLNG